ncbi:uncharacterized protein LOC141668863 [Apium graveolens]|uniref:uncharacterized protein LOC141668863 n=1 Tax=Apium graveolens TaxID=4045 RepID=UPI003D7C05BF
MAAIRATSNIIMKDIFSSSSLLSFKSLSMFRTIMFPKFNIAFSRVPRVRPISYTPAVRCAAGEADRKKTSSRLSQVQQVLHEAQERAKSAGNEPIPKITIDHVSLSFARSGGPGGQNVNKVNTKVDMRFNVKDAHWLSDRVKERIMQVEKNRINKDGEIVISSTKTRTQKGNIEDALGKLQAIIDAASYVPPPPSEEQMKKIAKIAATGERKRLQSKKILSDKKAFRRSRDCYD